MKTKLWNVKAYFVKSYIPIRQYEINFVVPAGESLENIKSKAQAIMEREYGTRKVTCSYVKELIK